MSAAPSSAANFEGQPYLERLQSVEHAFPALKGFLEKLRNVDEARKLVEEFYKTHPRGSPGRCCGLQFNDASVSPIEGYENGFNSVKDLQKYLTSHPAKESRENNERRLFILEDMEAGYVDALGDHLGVDPLVFSEQMNTWNFTDSRSVPHRALPSMSNANKSFTLRYYEVRTLERESSVVEESFQMTFAVNRRKYERWRDIDIPSMGMANDNGHALVRRCASFWTSQESGEGEGTEGWDAVILVDPGMAVASTDSSVGTGLGPVSALILQDRLRYEGRAAIWNAHPWDSADAVELRDHTSWPYHHGCTTLAPLLSARLGSGGEEELAHFMHKRDRSSPLDEMVYYWTQVASPSLISEANEESSNAAYYLLKHIAQNWTSQLELINCTVAKGEYISDDYQAQIDNSLSGAQWKSDLANVNQITKNINYARRQANHYWRSMMLNLERLGVQLGSEAVDEKMPRAIRGAQKDLLSINARLQPLRERVEGLGAVASDLANLRAAFKGITDGEFAMRLSLFAAIIFPVTLVASILSMGDDFLPGKKDFWIFWVFSVPLVVIFAVTMVYGRRPDKILKDMVKSRNPLVEGRPPTSMAGGTAATGKVGHKKLDPNSASSC